jgi:outer membrane receptor protein involved in Fe transport
VATGFSPPTSQDKIFGMNFGLEPGTRFGLGRGNRATALEQTRHSRRNLFPQRSCRTSSDSMDFLTRSNLGKARTQGIECELRARPLDELDLIATYTYLDAEKNRVS